MKKRKHFFKQMTAGVLSSLMIVGVLPIQSMADEQTPAPLVLKGQAELEIGSKDNYPPYDVKVEVGADKEGTILYVKDDGTQPSEKSKRSWRIFIENTDPKKGFAGFVGKNKDTLDEVDVVTQATQSSNAVKEAVRQALGTMPPSGSPQDPQEKKVVTLREVNKIKPPKTDEHPIKSIYKNGQYTGKIHWEPFIELGGHFAEETKYIARISLTPEEGWTFEGLAEDFFKVPGMESASFEASTGMLTVQFPRTGPDPKIGNFEEPKLSEFLLKREPKVKKDPGVYTGKGKAVDREARKDGRKGEIITKDSPRVEIEAKVTLDDQGKVSEVKATSIKTNPNFPMRTPTNNFKKYQSHRFYIGKTYEEILQMDVRYRVSPFVPLLESDKKEDKMHLYAQALHRAILNALGHPESEEVPAGSGTVFSGGATVDRFNYTFKTKIEVDEQGRILNAWDEINDKETDFEKGGLGNLTNGEAIRHFRDELGYDRFLGKTVDEVAALDMDMYGLDVVSGATYSSKGAKNAILEALRKAGHEPSGAKPSEPEFVAWYSFKLDKNKIKYANKAETYYGEATAVVFLDRDKKISKIKIVANDIPAGVFTPGLAKDWRRFVQVKGFHRYYFMDLEQVKNAPADNPKKGDLFTAHKAEAVAKLVKSELVKVMEKHEEKAHRLTVNKEAIGYFVLGNQIVLDAPPVNAEGVAFKEWKLLSGGGEFDDESKINAHFEMSDDEVEIEAVYENPSLKKEIQDQEVMTIEENESYHIKNGDTLEIHSGGTLDVKGKLIVGAGGTLTIENGGIVKGSGNIKREGLKQQEIADIADQIHTGQPILPQLHDKETGLLLDTEDYILGYENNTKVGMGIVRLIPKGSLSERIEKTFRIITKKPSAPPAVYRIELSPSGDKDFGVVEEGYSPVQEYVLRVRNTGNRPTGRLEIVLSGPGKEDFVLSTEEIAGLSAGESTTIAIQPKEGLHAGRYEAVLMIQGTRISEKISLSFMVGDEESGYREWLPRKSVTEDKEWVIHFNQAVDMETVTTENIQVKTVEDKQPVDIRLERSEDGKSIHVIASSPYTKGKSYVLYIQNLRTEEGKMALKEKIKMYFDIIVTPLSGAQEGRIVSF